MLDQCIPSIEDLARCSTFYVRICIYYKYTVYSKYIILVLLVYTYTWSYIYIHVQGSTRIHSRVESQRVFWDYINIMVYLNTSIPLLMKTMPWYPLTKWTDLSQAGNPFLQICSRCLISSMWQDVCFSLWSCASFIHTSIGVFCRTHDCCKQQRPC